MKFGKSDDFVFVGKEIVATASGIYVSFLDLNTRERRIERFDSKERGDGASCLAGHPVRTIHTIFYLYIYLFRSNVQNITSVMLHIRYLFFKISTLNFTRQFPCFPWLRENLIPKYQYSCIRLYKGSLDAYCQTKSMTTYLVLSLVRSIS